MRLPAQPDSVGPLRRAAVAFAAEHAMPRPDAVGLAVTEAVTNVVLHAYEGQPTGEVRLVICAKPEGLVVVVRDWGRGMVPRTDSPGLGLGLPTIATLASVLDVEAADGRGTLLRMSFRREVAQAA